MTSFLVARSTIDMTPGTAVGVETPVSPSWDSPAVPEIPSARVRIARSSGKKNHGVQRRARALRHRDQFSGSSGCGDRKA